MRHRKRHNPRVRKTRTDIILQGNYGYGDGWEDLVAESTWKEARQRKKEYQDNESGNYRIIRRHVKLSEGSNPRKSRQVEMVHGIDFTKDFYTLPNSDVVKLVEAADRAGYRKPKNANGSRGRYYFYAVKRKFKLNPRKRRTKRRSR